ncbi:hypothetical protein DL95DRAFT_379430 [Leptodontidium sp. 2 PMI_412]|nr:hypothetical protein DL95DRAFT_379430 [Leptodontidium sp. 2 PMI_412]
MMMTSSFLMNFPFSLSNFPSARFFQALFRPALVNGTLRFLYFLLKACSSFFAISCISLSLLAWSQGFSQ